MPASPRILFAGGCTPSQLNPGLSVAGQLGQRLPKAEVLFSGPSCAKQRQIVRSAGYDYLSIPSRPAPRNPLQTIRFVTDNLAGYCSARWLLGEHQVALVVGLGGYGSAPIVKAAVSRGIPVILLEQNAVPHRTTKWLSDNSSLVCLAYEQTQSHLSMQTPVLCSGNPVSPGFENLYRCKQTKGNRLRDCLEGGMLNGKKRLVVLGGVGGSRALNMAVPGALRQLGESIADWQVVHQTGDGQLQETERRYQKASIDALAVTYIDELASVLFTSDLVICRAGGTQLAELALAETPALLVPQVTASDESQLANARIFTSAGACRIVEEGQQIGLLQSSLTSELSQLMSDEQCRHEMRSHMARMAKPQASAEIAGAICKTLYGDCDEKRLAA